MTIKVKVEPVILVCYLFFVGTFADPGAIMMINISSSSKPYPYDQETVEKTAKAMGQLKSQASQFTKLSLEKILFMELEKRRVGTFELEVKSLVTNEGDKGNVKEKGAKRVRKII